MKIRKAITFLLLSLLSGTLLGASSPPFGAWYCSFIALIPLLYLANKSPSYKQVFIFGGISGMVAAGIAGYPLMSASVWTGWQDFSGIDGSAYMKSQEQALFGMLIIVMLLYGAMTGLFAQAMRYLKTLNTGIKYLVAAPVFWLILVEWLPSKLWFDYLWMPIGSSLLELPWLAQTASLGGVWALGFIVVAINGLLFAILFTQERKKNLAPAFVITLASLVVLSIWGNWRISNLAQTATSENSIKVAIIQFSKPVNTDADYTSFYMDKHYFNFVKKIYAKYSGNFDILVLPESINFGSVTLDGSASVKAPDKVDSTIQNWYDALKPIMQTPGLLIHGADTVDKGKDYNSILVWNKSGPIWHYDKQKLVPFAEYVPKPLEFLQLSGRSVYSAGTSTKIARTNRGALGFLICQEVLFPALTNQAVKDGAQLLISVGNDGVFSNPAVARANDIAARLRAIESGRYIIRAQKSGISSVIEPSGLYRSWMDVYEKGVLFSKAYIRSEKTVYTHIFKFVLLFLVALAAILIGAELKGRRR